jgi:hypothetical protein
VAGGTTVVDLSVGHVDFRETGPYGPGHWVVQPELDCAPCGFDQVCAHHACKDRIPPDFVTDLLLHVLKGTSCPSRALGARLYESDVDEDGLGTFRVKTGTESPTTAWYATFWRRYWYEAHTGLGSNVPAPDGPPPDVTEVRGAVQRLLQLLKTACRRADEIARLAGRAAVNLTELKRLQHEQGAEQERLLLIGMSTAATAPVTAAFLRQRQSDNVQGLHRLACHQSDAYRAWLTRLTDIDRRLFKTIADPADLSGLRGHVPAVCAERRVA